MQMHHILIFQDGSALDTSHSLLCAGAGGPPKCEDGGPLSCADGTPLGFLANIIG